MGDKLIWNELPDKKSSYIRYVKKNYDPKKREQWDVQVKELLRMTEGMHKVFFDRVKNLHVENNEDK